MTTRSREELAQELAHIQFLLNELPHWDSSSVPRSTRNYLVQRYERQERILNSVLAESAPAVEPVAPIVEAAPAPVPAPVVEAPRAEGAVVTSLEPFLQHQAALLAQTAPVETAAPVEALLSAAEVPPAPVELPPAPAAEPTAVQSLVEAFEKNPHVAQMQDAPASPLPASPLPAPRPPASRLSFSMTAVEEDEEDERDDEASALPPVVTEPLFDAPVRQTPTVRLVEAVSTWDTIWRPFLYESIGWFIGAFLIVAGSLYLAFDSWAGLTSSSRSLVVFGMTAGYSAAFSICGALLARREALAGAGRILGLIGAAVGPFAGLALGPLDGLGLTGISPFLLLPLLGGWSVGAATLVRKPAESFDEPSRPLLQGALVGATAMMGLAPLVARLGAAAVWFDLLPCALFAALARQSASTPRNLRALTFTLAAPAYLTLLYAVRLHVALASGGEPPAAGGYAPFLAFLLITALRFRTMPSDKAVDSLSVGVTALLVGCLVLAATGSPPAFIVTAATFTWTMYGLSRGSSLRIHWLYPAYAGAYLVYTALDQLLPGAARTWVASALPPRTFTALLFVLAGSVLAGVLQARAARTSSERDAASAEVLLRVTAVASPLVVLWGHVSPELGQGLAALLCLMVWCVACGERFDRRYLSIVGAGLGLVLPVSSALEWGSPAASVLCGVAGLAFAALPVVRESRARSVYNAAAGWLAVSGFAHAMHAGARGESAVGLALCGAAMLLVAWSLANPHLFAVAAFGAAFVLPKLASLMGGGWVPLAFAVAALGLAVLGERGGRMRLLGASGVAHALLAFCGGLIVGVPWFGVVLLMSAAAVGVASRTLPVVRPLAVLFAGIALLPRMGTFSAWPWMTPTLSLILFLPWSLGSSVVAARRGADASTRLAGLLALVFPVLAADAGHTSLLHAGDVVGFLVLAALFTARSLHPSLSVIMASWWPLAIALRTGDEPLAWVGALLLSGLALLESFPAPFRLLAGERRFALTATLCAIPFLALATGGDDPGLGRFVLAGTVLLPLVWTRANRHPFFAALASPFVLFMVFTSREWMGVSAALPVLALGVVRAVEHWLPARRLLLGGTESKAARGLSEWMQASLATAALVVLLARYISPPALALLVASLVLLPGRRPSVRLGLGILLLFPCVPLHLGAIALLLVLGLLTYHVPAALDRFLCALPDPRLRPLSVAGALLLVVGTALLGAPTPGVLLAGAGCLGLGAFLLSQPWMLTASLFVLASASLGQTPTRAVLHWRPEASLAFVAVALGATLLSAVCQVGRVQLALSRMSRRLVPDLGSTWSEPTWLAGALTLLVPVLWHLGNQGAGGMSLAVALLGGLAALGLMVTRERLMANVAVALLAGVIVAAVPPAWSPAVLSGTGLLLCGVGAWLDARERAVGAALHHAGWMLSLVSVLGLRELRHPAVWMCILTGLGAAWTVVYRRREREVVGWGVTWVAVHALLLHGGAVLDANPDGRWLPLMAGAASALLALGAHFAAGERARPVVTRMSSWMALVELASVVGMGLLNQGPGELSPGWAVLAGVTALGLMVTRERAMARGAVALLAGVLVAALPPAWSPVAVSALGLALCMVGTELEKREEDVGAALHQAGWVLSCVSVLGLRTLRHPATPLCLLVGLGSAWAVVYRRRERELLGWAATLGVAHVLMACVGVALSTGRGEALILPVFGALSALLATLALNVAGERVRRRVGHGFAGVALVEVLGSLVLVPGSMGARSESLLACGALAVLCFALVRRAVREEDEGSAFLAQGVVSLGYLSVRLHALAADLGPADSVVALAGGVLFCGLYVFAQREGAGLPAFRRPALWGAFLFPMVGLLTAPWQQPLYMAALLVGYAAHFAALASHPSQRGVGSLVSAVAFNAALFLVWLRLGVGEPQYYVIPVALSVLVLLRVFREQLEPETRAKWRALAITFVYVAGAWKPLLFQDGQAMVLCVVVCVVGVVAGMALRIRSYVYLGSAFMVTCVVANLARFGMRDHRLGAAFLSLLGVGVVGFMVLFTAKRAELLERYARVRALMDTWEG